MKKIILTFAFVSLTSLLSANPVQPSGCLGCHGTDWSKKALGKSLPVSEMTQNQIAKSLIGYKNGTYGRSMKGIMASQVKRYTEEELTAFSRTIGK